MVFTMTKELVLSDAPRMPAHRDHRPLLHLEKETHIFIYSPVVPQVVIKMILYSLHARVVLLGELCAPKIL
jgi:hypothetical protein